MQYLGFPCIEVPGSMMGLARPASGGRSDGRFVTKSWQVCDCGNSMINGSPASGTSSASGVQAPTLQGGSTTSSTADAVVAKPLHRMTSQDAALQWLTAYNSGSVVSKVAVDDWQVKRLQELVPGFEVPGLLLINVSKPLFQQPADMTVKMFIIPDDSLKAASALLPSLTSLPLLIHNREQEQKADLPEVTLQLTLPSLRLPTLAIPNLAEVAQRMLAHVPSLHQLLPSLAGQAVEDHAGMHWQLNAMDFAGLTNGLSGAATTSGTPTLLSSFLSILNGSVPGQAMDVNHLLELLDRLRAAGVGDGPGGLLDIENMIVALDGLRRAGHGAMQVSQTFFDFLRSLNREAVARHLPDLSNIIDMAQTVHQAETKLVLDHDTSGIVGLLNSVKDRTYGTIDLSGIASLVEGLQAADSSLRKLAASIRQAEANLFLNGDPSYIVGLLQQVMSGRLDMSGLHALVQGLQQAGSNVRNLIQTIQLAEARLILAHDPTDAVTLLQGVLGGTGMDLSGLNALLQLLQHGDGQPGHVILDLLDGRNNNALLARDGSSGAGAQQLTNNIQQVQGSMANVTSIVGLLQPPKSSLSPAAGSAPTAAQVAKTNGTAVPNITVTAVPVGAAAASGDTGVQIMKVVAIDTPTTAAPHQSASPASLPSFTAAVAAGAQSPMTAPQSSAMPASQIHTVPPTFPTAVNTVSQPSQPATTAAPAMSVSSTQAPTASLAMQSSMYSPVYERTNGAVDLQSLASLLQALGQQGFQLADLAGIMGSSNNMGQLRTSASDARRGQGSLPVNPLMMKEILSASDQVIAGGAAVDASDLALLLALMKARRQQPATTASSILIPASGVQPGQPLGARNNPPTNMQANSGPGASSMQVTLHTNSSSSSTGAVGGSAPQPISTNEPDAIISPGEAAAILSAAASDSSDQDSDAASTLYSAGAVDADSYKQFLQESKQEPAWSSNTAFMDPKEPDQRLIKDYAIEVFLLMPWVVLGGGRLVLLA
eukprot:gene8255-8443_t